MATLVTPIAGGYTSSFTSAFGNTGSLGLMEDGFKFRFRRFKEAISRSDAYYMTPLDGIYAGAQCQFQGTALEWNKARLLELLFPFGVGATATSGTTYLELGVPGDTDGANCGSLVLTAIANTPAATANT